VVAVGLSSEDLARLRRALAPGREVAVRSPGALGSPGDDLVDADVLVVDGGELDRTLAFMRDLRTRDGDVPVVVLTDGSRADDEVAADARLVDRRCDDATLARVLREAFRDAAWRRELARSAARQSALVEAASRALNHRLLADLFADVLELATVALEAAIGAIVEHDGDGARIAAACGLDDVDDAARLEQLLRDGEVSAVSVTIPGAFRTRRSLTVGSRERRTFDRADVEFVEALARIVGAAIDRHESGDAKHAVFDGARDAILISNDEARYIDANPAASDLLGVSPDEIVGKSPSDFVIDDNSAARESGTVSLRRPDGTRRVADVRSTASFRPGRHLAILRDVTEREKVEEERRRSMATMHTLLANLPDCVVLSRRGMIHWANDTMLRQWGFGALSEVIGRLVVELVAPEERDEVTRNLSQPFQPDRVSAVERTGLRVDGSRFTMELRVMHLVLDGTPTVVALGRDITERKRLQPQLMQADRMHAVGMLAAGVAHEINNPLASVNANLAFLIEALRTVEATTPPRDVAEIRQLLDEAAVGGERIRHIVRDLKTLSRGDDDRLEGLDLRRVIDVSVSMARNQVRHSAQLVKDYAEIPLVLGNESRLGQLFLNLVINAAQAIPVEHADAHQIRIEVRPVDNHVRVRVSDTGYGISSDVLPRIFDPFFTTKPLGVGTGLGLSICQGIVHAMGGTPASRWASRKRTSSRRSRSPPSTERRCRRRRWGASPSARRRARSAARSR
jgi:PAS domain S-box-containing protein